MRRVAELMTRDVVTLKEMDNLARIDELLRQERVRHLPVVRDGKLVGLVTHRDLLRALAKSAAEGPLETLWAMDFMQRDVATVHPNTPLRDAIQLSLNNKYGCLPVVDHAGDLVGIVTHADFVRLAAELLEDVDLREAAAEDRA
ncbi:MAG: CBS domain-containing protein [Myxococcaceae bacterium]|nr:CBS domain-containing protein [Myxococcaceae bacterium]MCI0673641.1 CBS domain-containing protein [Myxococcaceae bacterium]